MLMNAKLKTGKRGQETELSGRRPNPLAPDFFSLQILAHPLFKM
jgi:hypothetical protein